MVSLEYLGSLKKGVSTPSLFEYNAISSLSVETKILLINFDSFAF